MDRSKFFLIYIFPFLVLGIVLVMALATVWPAGHSGYTMDERLVLEILDLVNEHYVEPISRKNLTRRAIRGIVSDLDRYSDFLDVEAARVAEEDNLGEFGGLGVHIDIDSSKRIGRLLVSRPFREGPARAAGILPGDRIVGVDGEDLPLIRDVADLGRVVRRLKGTVGSRVRLMLERDEGETAVRLERELTRARVQVETVLACRLVDPDAGIGYLRIESFKERTVKELDAALARLNTEGMKALVIDLRKNGGGLLRRAAQVADRFLSRGVIVSTRGRHPEENESFDATQRTSVPEGLPLVVLINLGSASASEAVAGALQDYRRAVILGGRSYGKGVVQSVYRMGRTETSLKITTSRYYTPAGRCIDRIYAANRRGYTGGIIPDVLVKLTVPEDKLVFGPGGEWERWLADEVDPRTPPPPPRYPDSVDWQLTSALDLIRGSYPPGRALPDRSRKKKSARRPAAHPPVNGEPR